ncbi:MAG: endonuclease/exonuclease/phosphatase family protein [Clostridia bacterium]|nr:endonuclease/exonuclease/phosphatase family protein [Clostridia bacterium]
MKKTVSIILCVALLFVYAAVPATAAGKHGTLKMLAYNVSGIPVVGDFQGSVFTTANERAAIIGKLLNGTGADFIGVEEDFNGHKYLDAEMTSYPYKSPHSGGVAQGQGVNIYSSHKLYNLDRVKWNKEFGYLSGRNDALSNKGFIYSLMELEKGIYVDVITLHCDAGKDPVSVAARRDNFRQLAEYINTNLNDGRALIVLGDFNFSFKRNLKDDIVTNLMEPTGLKDVWAEVYNGGLTDFSNPAFDRNSQGDSVDRALYRSGRYMELVPVSRTIPQLRGENGEVYTDHPPMLAEFTYTVTGRESVPARAQEPAQLSETVLNLKEAAWTALRFFQIIIGLTEIPYLITELLIYRRIF